MPQQLSDVGTREAHLYDLLECWVNAADYISEKPMNKVVKDNKLEELSNAIGILQRTIEAGNDFDESFYRKEINQVYRDRKKLITSEPTNNPN